LTLSRTVAGEPSRWTIADLDSAMHPFGAVALEGETCTLRQLALAELEV